MVTFKLNRSAKLVCAVAAVAAYFLVAYQLKLSYVPPYVSSVEPIVAGTKIFLRRPFDSFLDSSFGVTARDLSFETLSDTVDNNQRSTIEIYEDDRRMGPAHSKHADVATVGRGRFSHWAEGKSAVFVFSSSDNSDPRTNGRAYWAVKPDTRK